LLVLTATAYIARRTADRLSGDSSAQFYAQFVSASLRRLEENTRETRETLSEIVGGGIKFMAIDDRDSEL
jgi:hypothetical protein